MPHTGIDEAPNASIQAELTADTLPGALDLESIRREAARVVAELRAWARRDRDGWDVARARDGRRWFAPAWAGERGKESARRGSQASARAGRGLPRGGREYRRGPLADRPPAEGGEA